MKNNILSFLCISLFFSACSSNNNQDNGNKFSNDFEAIGTWTENQQVLRESAKSGIYSTFTDTVYAYTQTMKMEWKYLKNKSPKSVEVIAWVMSQNADAKGKLVFSLEKDGKNLIWEGSEIQKVIKVSNKWMEVKLNVSLKPGIEDASIIKVYGVNDGKRKVYWDDFTVTFN